MIVMVLTCHPRESVDSVKFITKEMRWIPRSSRGTTMKNGLLLFFSLTLLYVVKNIVLVVPRLDRGIQIVKPSHD